MTMQIETVAVATLRPYTQNARTHSKKQIRQIAKSIERFGFCNPVLVDDQMQIIAGHGRVAAATLLGIEQVPTVKLVAPQRGREAGLYSGRQSPGREGRMGPGDPGDRAAGTGRAELRGRTDGFRDRRDRPRSGGSERSGRRVGRTVKTRSQPIRLDQAVTSSRRPLGTWTSSPAMCGCTSIRASYERLLEGAKADFVFTDPPYNVAIDGHVCGLGRIRHADFAMGCGEMSAAEFTGFLTTVFKLLANTHGRWLDSSDLHGLAAHARDARGRPCGL